MPADRRIIRLLLLEDNPDDVFLLRAALMKHRQVKFEIVHCERLKEAVEVLGSETFDVVVTDLNVPDSVGVETVKELTNLARELPVIALTGWEDPALGARLIQEGATAYWSKDRIGGSELSEAITNTVDGMRAQH